MAGNMLDTWQRIAVPSKEGEKNARRVDGTNCWLSKSNDSSLGLIMVGVEPPNRKLNLENITLDFWDRMTLEYKGESLDLDNCLALDLDPGCDAGVLVAVLDRMADYEASGGYRTDIIIKVLEEVVRLFKKERRPPTRREVIGAWGELAILEMVILSSPSAIEAQRRITCWESYSGRTIIDFTFPHIGDGLAVEVKTSASRREHHILSTSQLIPPDDFSEGWLASLHIREVDHISGVTCRGLVDRILSSLHGNEEEVSGQRRALLNRMELRGSACVDERFGFILPDGGLRIIRMEDVPQPILKPQIIDVEWKVDLKEAPFEDSIPLFNLD